MRPTAWRAVLLVLCASGIFLTLASFADQFGMGAAPWYGVWGGYFEGSSEAYHLKLRGVDPSGAAARGGMLEGDLVDIREHTLLERLSFFGQPQAGRPMTFWVERTTGRSKAVVVPDALQVSRFWNFVVWTFASLWLLAFAALIAWRRPYADNNLLLTAVLAFAAIGFTSESLFWGFPWPWAYITIAVVNQAVPIAVALWAVLASGFARPLSTARRIAIGVCITLVALAIFTGEGTPDRTIGIAPLIATITLWFDPTFFIGPVWTAPITAAIIAALACSALAVADSRGIDRQRCVWLLVPLGAFFVTMAGTTLAFHFLSYAVLLAMGQVYSVVALITPLLLTYAALNRRLIDVGFVLNRTVVFAIVSTIVIGAFVLVEWAAGAWLVNASHSTSVVVGMVVALVLGLSLRYIHRYVDRFVDHVLFRKRHDDESALRHFAHEASYITDRATLLERASRTVREHTNAQYADIFVRNGSATFASTSNGKPQDVGENDSAIVALRAWNKPVDLHALAESDLPGELAFPLMSRGRLVGALVCGPKRDGETYAPDESDALLALAHGVGSALDVLEAKGEQGPDPALTEICDSVRALAEATRSLPDAIAERLRGDILH